jgi:tetratricopeptide (TPR) repeat protein
VPGFDQGDGRRGPALALWRFWSARQLGEGRRWLEAVVSLGGTEGQERRRAFSLLVAGILETRHGDYDRAAELDGESLALYRALGHRRSTHGPLREFGAVAYHRGDYDLAVRLSEQALAIAREFGNAPGSGLLACNLVDALRARGDLDQARKLLEESLSSLRQQKQQLPVLINALVNTLARLGSIECEKGEAARAGRFYGESLELIWRYVGRAYETVACLEGLAREDGAAPRGFRRVARGDGHAPHAHASETARGALGKEAFEAAWAQGHEMPFERSITDALGV